MEKAEILALVRKSPVSVKETLAELGVPRSTYYAWRKRKEELGVAGLTDKRPAPRHVWNKLRDSEVETILAYAHRYRRSRSCTSITAVPPFFSSRV